MVLVECGVHIDRCLPRRLCRPCVAQRSDVSDLWWRCLISLSFAIHVTCSGTRISVERCSLGTSEAMRGGPSAGW